MEPKFDTLLKDVLSSVMFLSRLPLPKKLFSPELPNFGKTAYTFPIAGLLIGLPAALVAGLGLILGLPTVVGALLCIAIMLITTGALHEDGLADVADGFWGGHSVQRKLEIMRDSAIGTYGTLALIIVIGLKVTLLADLFSSGGWPMAVVLIITVASFSRTAMLAPWALLPSARPKEDNPKDDNEKSNEKHESGLSVRYGAPEFSSAVVASLISSPLIIALYFSGFSILSIIIGIALMKIATIGCIALARHHVGGHTGDILGATQQMSELGLLLGLALAT